MEKIYHLVIGIAALLIILGGFLPNDRNAEAKKVITSGTTTPKTLNAKIVDLAAIFGNSDGGVCYRLADNDGEGFTFLIANNGTITGSLTCD